jgi:hypothetical protein
MRELMLAADLDELVGIGESPFAAHVRQCEGCRLVANRIASGTRRFGAELALAGPSALTASPTGLRRRAPRSLLVVAVGVAAAASIALIAHWPLQPVPVAAMPVVELAPNEAPATATSFDGPTFDGPTFDAPVVDAATVDAIPELTLAPPLGQVSVEVPEGRSAVVMQTRNPSMTVIWLHCAGPSC